MEQKITQYLNPPVVSATCSFELDSPDWPANVESLINIAAMRYDAPPLVQVPLGASLLGEADLSEATIILRNSARSRSVTVAATLLTLRTDPPYEGWLEFSTRISEFVALLIERFPTITMTSASLSYENLLEVSEDESLTSMVTIAVEPPTIGNLVATRGARFETFRQPDSSITTTLSVFRYQRRSNVGPQFIAVNINSLSPAPEHALLSSYEPSVKVLHDTVSGLFEAVITDEARKSFGHDRE